jgi:hypothetical protein
VSDYPPCRWRSGDCCRSPKVFSPGGGLPVVDPALCGGCLLRDHEPVKAARPEKPRVQIAELAAARRH